jgi:hypothetical protein
MLGQAVRLLNEEKFFGSFFQKRTASLLPLASHNAFLVFVPHIPTASQEARDLAHLETLAKCR